MARNVERDQDVRKERCQQILTAALELFAKQGLSDTKISDIAKKAGMSHGLVYNYFPSKEEIYITLMEINLCAVKSAIEDVSSRPIRADEKLAALVERFHGMQCNDAVWHQMFVDQFMASDSISESLKDSIKQKLEDNLLRIAGIIAEGQDAGLFIDEDPQELALLFFTFVNAKIVAQTRGASFFTNKPFRASIIRLFSNKC
ncbi:TetR/AcrR family transcriptional regulator [Paenibacillus sp. y28]|uniref:TetR/AcrR family transcriptional regulator n=1 Tax=Paenibacillus sp. y28 TaxID=3129110 RepID=UPI003017E291